MSSIKNTATCFGKLFAKIYEISIVSKNGIRSDFKLNFLKEDFLHAAGIQYLTDILFNKNPFKIYDDIMSDIITDDTLAKSSFYEKVDNNYVNVKERIIDLALLEQCLDSNNLIFNYIDKKNQYSKIKAEFMIEANRNGKTYFIFLSKRKGCDEYKVVSFFEKNCQYKTEKRYWLYKAKYDFITSEKIIFCDKLSKNNTT